MTHLTTFVARKFWYSISSIDAAQVTKLLAGIALYFLVEQKAKEMVIHHKTLHNPYPMHSLYLSNFNQKLFSKFALKIKGGEGSRERERHG